MWSYRKNEVWSERYGSDFEISVQQSLQIWEQQCAFGVWLKCLSKIKPDFVIIVSGNKWAGRLRIDPVSCCTCESTAETWFSENRKVTRWTAEGSERVIAMTMSEMSYLLCVWTTFVDVHVCRSVQAVVQTSDGCLRFIIAAALKVSPCQKRWLPGHVRRPRPGGRRQRRRRTEVGRVEGTRQRRRHSLAASVGH